MKQPAVFLDRDGTLIEEVNYLSRLEDLRLFPFTVKAVQMLKDAGFLLFVVTNQSGIGRGVFNESAMHNIHRHLQDELSGAIDSFYFCPHLPDAGCECRKPGTGMIDAALKDFDIDIGQSWIIGDKDIDVETGRKIGLSTILVSTGYGALHAASLEVPPDFFEGDLLSATNRILGV